MSGALSSKIRERAPRSSLRFILGALEAVAAVATYASHRLDTFWRMYHHLGQWIHRFRQMHSFCVVTWEKPVVVDAAALGSYVHRLRWKGTNLASASGISAALYQLARPTGRHVDHILDKGQYAQAVVHADQPPLVVVNPGGHVTSALPTLVSYLGSHAF